MGSYKHHRFKTQDGKYILEAISGWLPIKNRQVTQQSSLFDYGDKESEMVIKNGRKRVRTVWYFTWCHKDYPVDRIMTLPYPTFFENEDEKLSYIMGTIGISNNMGFEVEMSDGCDAVRLFTERKVDEYGRMFA